MGSANGTGDLAARRAPGFRGRRWLSVAAVVTVVGSVPFVGVTSAQAGPSTELYSWGYNVDGQLGNGNTANENIPVKVQLPSGVTATAAAAGGFHSLAIGSDGKLYAWGDNTYGQLGNGTGTPSTTPVVVSMPAGVTATAVAAGEDHSVALGSDGNVYDWGYNGFGQLGNGTTNNSTLPIKVGLPAGVTATAVAAGNYMSEALGSNGDVYAWGDGADGQLGDGKTVNELSPIQVNVSFISAVAAGGLHSLVISLGTVYAYGYGGFGQLGDNKFTNASTRVKVLLPSGVNGVAIAAGLDRKSVV